MELKKHLSPRSFLIGMYVFAFLVYIIYGLQPAKASYYNISTKILIPSINLSSDVTELKLENQKLNTPDEIVGSFSKYKNKTLLIGHSSTVFENLSNLEIKESVFYDQKHYIITEKKILLKSDIRMSELLSESERDTLIIMTCAGEDLGNGDATERLILTAKRL